MTGDSGTATPSASPRRDYGELIIPAVLVLVGTVVIAGIVTMDEAGDGGLFGAKAFPWIVAGLCYVVAILMAVSVFRPTPRPQSADPGDEADLILDHGHAPAEASNWRSVVIVVGGVLLFILILEPIGWLISGTLLFAIVAVGLGARNHIASVLGGLGIASVIQLAFSGLLGIYIPPGILG
ncbi:tripartite tricarboxylate transporter TctB family protein [Gordonia sp. PKS22-38]|uniref:Tripartite tricarboxylate transporter TctB family protein n=1 Tax=Gordonia prachuapensis TaxID=3115651 RepID=A0ABU7MXA5_9ACTN|nr:tripartite tricarboxylate transporter TctB family protein [Gordonia sp. PKS22-38]